MKKTFCLALAVILLGLMVTACGSKQDKVLDTDGFFTQAFERISYDDELIRLSDSVIKDFYSLSFEGLEEYRIYVSGTMATANELVVFKLKDEKAIESAKEAVNRRLEDQKANYQNYNPAQMQRIENALVHCDSNYLLFSVSNDQNDDVLKLFNEYLK